MQYYYKLLDWIPLEKLYWSYLSENPKAIHMLEQHPDKICWWNLSLNSEAIHLLEQYPEKIDWEFLSLNPNAMHMLFRLDHARMREDNEAFREELVSYVFDPDRLMRLSQQYEVDFRTYLSMY